MLLLALGVAVLAATAVTAGSSLLRWCPNRTLAAMQLLLPWWCTASLAVAAVAAAMRHVPLLAGALAVAALPLAQAAPKVGRRRRTARDAGGPSFALVLANLYLDNPDPAAALRQLLARRPDVLVMTELTPALHELFLDLGGGTMYPHAVHVEPIEGEYALGIFSALPLGDAAVRHRGPLRIVEAVVDPARLGVRVLAVHPHAPDTPEGFRRWREQLRELRRVQLESEGPTIVVGDLNAGPFQAPYEALLRARFRDAHADRGTALAPSWGTAPSLPRWVPAFVARLDHLLVSPEVRVSALEDLEPVGSDHRPFAATLVVAGRGSGRVTG